MEYQLPQDSDRSAAIAGRISEELAGLPPSEARRQLMELDLRDYMSLIQVAGNKEIHKEVRRLAVVVIGCLRIRSAVNQLLENMAENDPNLALSSANALASVRSRQSTLPLLDILRHCPYPRSREAAAMVFKSLRDERAFTALKQVLLNPGELAEVRFQVADALANWRPERTVSAFLTTAEDPDPEVRWISAYALAFAPGEASEAALRRLSTDKAAPVGTTSVGEQARESLDALRTIVSKRRPPGKTQKDGK
jgi:HEAT repeat protein